MTGSAVKNPNAPQASHMFFGRATSGFNAMFATHPPLKERIKRIDPSWDGEFPELDAGDADASAAAAMPGAAGFAGAESGAGAGAGTSVADAVSHVGQPTPEHIEYAADLIGHLPGPVVAAARDALRRPRGGLRARARP